MLPAIGMKRFTSHRRNPTMIRANKIWRSGIVFVPFRLCCETLLAWLPEPLMHCLVPRIRWTASIPQMAGLFFFSQKVCLRWRSISSALVLAVENKPGDGLRSKRSFCCKSILDFVESYVCSLIYKFAFSADCVSHLHSHLGQGDMAMSVRACLDLLPGLTTVVRNFCTSLATVKMVSHTQ